MIASSASSRLFDRSGSNHQIPAPVLFVLSGLSMYLGAALAVGLFHVLSPSGVAWLRVLGAAVVFLAWRRPKVAAWPARRWVLAGVFGVVTAVMNLCFYEAIARIPLGTAVAIEFAGPVTVAAFGSRSARDVGALVLVAAGVLLIAKVEWHASPVGLALIAAAAVLWATYIVLGKRVASGESGIDDLAVGMGIAALALSPLVALTGPVWSSGRLLLLGVGVGVLSTVIPYGLDQVVLARIGRARYAVLIALLPLTASLVGLVLLRQIPTLAEGIGALLVIVGVALRSARES